MTPSYSAFLFTLPYIKLMRQLVDNFDQFILNAKEKNEPYL